MTDDTETTEAELGNIAHEIEEFLHPTEGSAVSDAEQVVEQADPTLTDTVAPVEADVEAPTPGAVVAAASPTTEAELGKLLADTGTALDGLSTQGTPELDAARNALGTLRTSLFAHISKWGV